MTYARFLLLLAFIFPACGDELDESRFPCGDNGGSCDRDSEVCIQASDDGCTTCVARPPDCDPEATCGCLPPGTDPVYANFKCQDAGTCDEQDGGLVLTCLPDAWGCG
jgi:hypothetical protein